MREGVWAWGLWCPRQQVPYVEKSFHFPLKNNQLKSGFKKKYFNKLNNHLMNNSINYLVFRINMQFKIQVIKAFVGLSVQLTSDTFVLISLPDISNNFAGASS